MLSCSIDKVSISTKKHFGYTTYLHQGHGGQRDGQIRENSSGLTLVANRSIKRSHRSSSQVWWTVLPCQRMGTDGVISVV
jgi:hypothetical protein